MGLATSGDQVWIAEFMGQRIQKFDNDGNYAGVELGGGGTPLPYRGHITDVTIDADGNVWLAIVYADNTIFVLDPDGNLLKTLGSPEGVPTSVAFDSQGNVYVVHSHNHTIEIYSSSDEHFNTIGVAGESGYDNDHFSYPFRVALDDQDRLYVADTNNQRIQIFDVTEPLTPTYQATIGVANQSGSDNDHFDQPSGVAVDENYIYVADSLNDRVQIFDTQTRAYVATIPSDCDDEDCANDVAVDNGGYIYVSEPERSVVKQYNNSFNLVRTFGVLDEPYPVDGDHFVEVSSLFSSPDEGLLVMVPYGQPQVYKLDAQGDLAWTLDFPEWPPYYHDTGFWLCVRNCPPDDVTTDLAGNVYVAFDTIHIYHPDGSYWKSIGSANNAGSGAYQFDRPDGVAVAPEGIVYVADSGNHRVQIFDQNLVYSDTLGVTGVAGSDHVHFDTPVDVVLDSAGNLYVADLGNLRVEVFDASLSYVRTMGPFEDGIDLQMAVDSQDRLYVADNDGQVKVYDPSGIFLTSISGDFGRGLAVDLADNLYLGRPGRNDIQVFTGTKLSRLAAGQ
jgi:YVTN family beta-propeller protein